MVAKALPAQRDFSAGELDSTVKRADQDQQISLQLKAGCRQLSNFRVLNSGAAQNRPGRRAQFVSDQSRVEEFSIIPGLIYRFVFAANTLQVRDLNNTVLFQSFAAPWGRPQLGSINYVIIGQTIYFCAQNCPPQVLAYSAGVWTLTVYAPTTTSGNQHRTVFYRLSPLGILMLPTATTGNITVTFSSDIATFNPTIVGTLMRFCGRQIKITGFTDLHTLSATVLESLPPGQVINTTTDPRLTFNTGDEIEGVTSLARGIVTAMTVSSVTVQLISITTNLAGGSSSGLIVGFLSNEVIASTGGAIKVANAGGDVTNTVPQSVAIWDEELFNTFRGWPSSCFADQNRLGFCGFPAAPNGISWSAIGSPGDLYVGANPWEAFYELAPDKVQVYFVVPGPESSEFVFCDKRIYYIPISPTNPLKPGSVAFQILSSMGAANVQPRAIDESLVYIAAGASTVMSIVALGAYYRPFETRALSRLRSHLIKAPIAIAVPTSQGTFDEQYIYVLNSDGSLAVGRFDIENGQIKGSVAWTPWTGTGTVIWCSARDATILFSTVYGSVNIVEILDDTVYLDAAMLVNAAPVGLSPPAGQGPLWFWAGQVVTLMDQSTRSMGTYQVDGIGHIVPQSRGGEDLASVSLVAGQAWNATIEPFVPAVQPGPDSQQRLRKRRVARFEVYVANSSGFRVDSLNADQQGSNLPAIGNPQTSRRVPAYNQGDDATKPPPLREQAYVFRPKGRAHDPRNAIIKDTPGPLQVLEIAMEVTV